jgi:hypothetical protein
MLRTESIILGKQEVFECRRENAKRAVVVVTVRWQSPLPATERGGGYDSNIATLIIFSLIQNESAAGTPSCATDLERDA